METWKAVEGWADQYEVSNLGQTRSLPRTVIKSNGVSMTLKGRILKPQPQESGHLGVTLPDGKRYLIHRLVASAFLDNPGDMPQVLHNNGDPSDNRASNLRWGTQSENMLDRRVHGTDPMLNRTHCAQNHEYIEENTRYSRKGTRICKRCSDLASKAWKTRNGDVRLAEGDERHGTLRAYTFYKCRCDPCRAAGARYRKSRYINRKRENRPR